MSTPRNPELPATPEPVLIPVVRYGDPQADAYIYGLIQDLCGERAATTFQQDMARGLGPIRSGT
jgi:hypothetical protein